MSSLELAENVFFRISSFVSRESADVVAAKKIINSLPRVIEKARKKHQEWVYIFLPPFYHPPDKQPPRTMNYWEIASILMRRNGGSPSSTDPILLPEEIGKKRLTCILYSVHDCEICRGDIKAPCWKCKERILKVPSFSQEPVRRYRVLAISTTEPKSIEEVAS